MVGRDGWPPNKSPFGEATKLPSLPMRLAGGPFKRQKLSDPDDSKLARELLWDVSRGETLPNSVKLCGICVFWSFDSIWIFLEMGGARKYSKPKMFTYFRASPILLMNTQICMCLHWGEKLNTFAHQVPVYLIWVSYWLAPQGLGWDLGLWPIE